MTGLLGQDMELWYFPYASHASSFGSSNKFNCDHQENLKFYQDPAGIIQVFGSLWWSMKTYCWSM
jgi:hypothetical protein